MEARGDLRSAKRHYRKAIFLRPDYMYALNNLGVLLTGEGRLEAAEELLKGALLIHVSSPELLASFGARMRNKGNLSKATDAYRKAVAIRPDIFEAIWNLSLVDLATGRFREEWRNYRYRPTVDRGIYSMPKYILDEDLSRGSFQIHAEQGLGDELFFHVLYLFLPHAVQKSYIIPNLVL